MINKVTLIGNVGRDAEVRRLENGTAVGSFSLATSESYKDKNGEWQTQTEWHNIIVWRELAERAEKHIKKGMLVYIEGKITTRKYNDKDGNERNTTEIVANSIRSLEKRQAETQGPTEQPTQRQNATVSNFTTGDIRCYQSVAQPDNSDLPF